MQVTYRGFNGCDDWEWINSHIGIKRVEDTSGIIALDGNGGRVAACVFDNFTGNSVQAHFLLLTPFVLRHGMIDVCYSFVFEHLGLEYMYGQVPENNEKALRLNKHMGWTTKCVLKDAFEKGCDYIIMELKKSDWIKGHGKEIKQQHTAVC